MRKIVRKVWGREEVIINVAYCGKILHIKRQHRCSLHHHRIKDETFYVLSGTVLLEIGAELTPVLLKTGDSRRIHPGKYHRFTGLADSRIIEFSTRHYDYDNYRETESEKISNKEFREIRYGMGCD